MPKTPFPLDDLVHKTTPPGEAIPWLEPDESWHDPMTRGQIGPTLSVLCPVCGFAYAHPGDPATEAGEDAYKASWCGRGDLIVLPFEGECGHRWEVCFGSHKGNVFAFVRSDPSHDVE